MNEKELIEKINSGERVQCKIKNCDYYVGLTGTIVEHRFNSFNSFIVNLHTTGIHIYYNEKGKNVQHTGCATCRYYKFDDIEITQCCDSEIQEPQKPKILKLHKIEENLKLIREDADKAEIRAFECRGREDNMVLLASYGKNGFEYFNALHTPGDMKKIVEWAGNLLMEVGK